VTHGIVRIIGVDLPARGSAKSKEYKRAHYAAEPENRPTVVVAIAAGAYFILGNPQDPAPVEIAGTNIVDVIVPDLSAGAKMGETIFNAKCAVCHGDNAAGVDGAGPPLVHKIYEPSHHGDMAFMLAPRRGVQAHHWRFGNMAPVEGLTDADIKQIILYVRELQRANGIT